MKLNKKHKFIWSFGHENTRNVTQEKDNTFIYIKKIRVIFSNCTMKNKTLGWSSTPIMKKNGSILSIFR